MNVVNLADTIPFITLDGSQIRELLAHRNSGIRHQSLAEARVPAGVTTLLHRHHQSEEIYYILSGVGRMQIEDESRRVGPGDAVAIPPGLAHCIENDGEAELVFLCCCAPGYEHEDTEIL